MAQAIMTLETLTACPICKSELLEPYHGPQAEGSKCRACHQIFLNPRMDDASAREYYKGAYREEVSKTGWMCPADVETQQARARYHLHAGWDYFEGARTALEIGCSLGYLMDKLNINFDISCVGIEPDVRYHQVDPACHYPLYTDISEVEPRKFDLILMSHSLEHMQHPLEHLTNLRDNYCHEGSKFLIEVPNVLGVPGTLNPHHPFAFSEETLNGLFERLGYRPLMFEKHGLGVVPMGLYLLGVYGAIE